MSYMAAKGMDTGIIISVLLLAGNLRDWQWDKRLHLRYGYENVTHDEKQKQKPKLTWKLKEKKIKTKTKENQKDIDIRFRRILDYWCTRKSNTNEIYIW